MARPRLQKSDAPLVEITSTIKALNQRWVSVGKELAGVLDLSPQDIRIDADVQSTGAWAGLQGRACERVTRNRGGAAFVVPLCSLPQNLVAWLGLQEVWDVRGGTKPFIFRQLSLTVHFGYMGNLLKPQVLRLEWPGIRDWLGAGLSFQSQGAGHPHWQIDILESLAHQVRPEPRGFEIEEAVEDFETEVVAPDLGKLMQSITIENMHLASAARWWLSPCPGIPGQHMNAPPNIEALSLWLTESIRYIRQELSRCTIRNR